MELIVLRLVQAVGGAMLMANCAAILTDAFPASQRGKALGINMVAAMSGQFIGLCWAASWPSRTGAWCSGSTFPSASSARSGPTGRCKKSRSGPRGRIDILGNLVFIAGLPSLLVGITYGILPYGSDTMGWTSPWVLAAIGAGIALLIAFPFVESTGRRPHVPLRPLPDPGLRREPRQPARHRPRRPQFMLIIWLQGIWLPLHGYDYADTPFWAGIYLLPLTIGFIIMGPISGILSDKYGPRWIATGGMSLVTLRFLRLAMLPYDFQYWQFGASCSSWARQRHVRVA